MGRIDSTECQKVQIHKLIIPYTLPGANEYIEANRKNRQAGGSMKRSVDSGLINIVKSQLRGVCIKNPVIMLYLWVEKNKRRDKDNIAFGRKFVQDALVKAKVIKNDGWKEIDWFKDEFDVDPVNPRVEVIIIECSKQIAKLQAQRHS